MSDRENSGPDTNEFGSKVAPSMRVLADQLTATHGVFERDQQGLALADGLMKA
jgi:hypothetical protein